MFIHTSRTILLLCVTLQFEQNRQRGDGFRCCDTKLPIIFSQALKMTNNDIVYLTGSTGFVGQMIVQQCENDASISKVYLPIRSKKGSSGEERFQSLFGMIHKCVFIHPQDPLPQDVTLVFLNAYTVKFLTPTEEIMADSMKPMLDILDQIVTADGVQSKVRGITVVSTAYIQVSLSGCLGYMYHFQASHMHPSNLLYLSLLFRLFVMPITMYPSSWTVLPRPLSSMKISLPGQPHGEKYATSTMASCPPSKRPTATLHPRTSWNT